MKYFANVIFLFVVIHTTVYARYLLVELQNEEHEQTAQFLAKATCDATRYAWASTIVSTCPGYKLLHTSSNPITAYTMCCEAVKADPECGNNWFKGPVTGRCFCEKKGYDCIRTAGVYTEYRFKVPASEQLIQPQTRELLSSPARDDQENEGCDHTCSVDPYCSCHHRADPSITCKKHTCDTFGPWVCICA